MTRLRNHARVARRKTQDVGFSSKTWIIRALALATLGCALPVRVDGRFHATKLTSSAPAGPGSTDVKVLDSKSLSDVGESGAEAVLVEFYLPWCPHCQHFAPKYAEAARLVKESVVSYAVNCEREGGLCSAFGAHRYPTVLFGAPSAFAERRSKDVKKYEGKPYETDDLVRFVDGELGTTYARALSGEKRPTGDLERRKAMESRREIVNADGSKVVISEFASTADIERATVEMYAQMTSEAVFVSTSEARKAFANFIGLASKAHPLEPCYRGLTNVLTSLDERWPEDGSRSTDEIRIALSANVHVCGIARGTAGTIVPRWTDCKGSVEGMRGYTCGLWTLLHAISVRVPLSKVSNAEFINALEGWIRVFFPCEECRAHFLSLIENPETGFDAYVDRADGAAIWLWNAHNLVNARLAREEANASDKTLNGGRVGGVLNKGDPSHPKVQFPTKSLCQSCYSRSAGGEDSWDEVHVSQFLTVHYLGDGFRRPLDMKTATKKADFLAPFIDDQSRYRDETKRKRRALHLGERGESVYDIFWMSTRYFFMFAFIIFMGVKAGVVGLFDARRQPRSRSPLASDLSKTPSFDKLA
ncbi:Thioredoxin, conserved site [Ostreococcus tauri]|uniref:Sulfhydryl oxidase n=1 Tax=Ostreococcus tauri TaxID=70448 RepID=A0A090M5E5_OSTTA|nr:Thioredoxin, conserved site [Ostreococcus tauri]CEF99460.1 Thioredoxin, conserved site [Ostreococcus tauri]|eukprot:XP_003081739.2 Thioredoxin, conserved site [Ostreococcus tauri]